MRIDVKTLGPNWMKWIRRNEDSRVQGIEFAVSTAEGLIIEDVDGNKYLDFTTQEVNTGHSNERVQMAVKQQMAKGGLNLGFQPLVLLSERLKEISVGNLASGKVGLCRGGTPAAERVMIMVKSYSRRKNIIVYQGGYHGDLFGSISLTMTPSYRKRLTTTLSNILYAPFPYCYRCPNGKEYPDCDLFCLNNISYIFDTVTNPEEIAAFFIEPIQQHGGVIIPPMGYLKEIKKICDDHGILLVDDEVATGFGRTGKMFAIEHWNIVPDVIFLGKPIANGLDLGAVISSSELMNYYWGKKGNPVACAAAIANIDTILSENLIENSKKIGEYIIKHLRDIQEKHEIIGDVRGKGLMIGIEMVKNSKKKPASKEASDLAMKAFENGLMVNVIGVYNNVIRLTPPLVVTIEQAEQALDILETTLNELKI